MTFCILCGINSKQAILVLDWSISKILLGQNELKFGDFRSTCGRFCIKFPQSRMKGE
jgi:hypothetical protein